MTRTLSDHHTAPNPCADCAAILTEMAALRLAMTNAETERDTAQAESAGLFDSPPMVNRDEWSEANA